MDTDAPAEAVAPIADPKADEKARRRAAILSATALAAVLALIGALVMTFSGKSNEKTQALKPRTSTPPHTTAATPTPTTAAAMPGSVDASSLFSAGSSGTSSGYSSAASFGGGGLVPSGGGSTLSLPSVQLPPAPNVSSTTPSEWSALFAPLAEAQNNTAAANLAGALTASTIGLIGAIGTSASVLLGNLILYAAYTNNGQGLLNQLQSSLVGAPSAAAALQSIAASLPQPVGPPDFSGLSNAFAAIAAAPPVGMAQLPGAPGLPTPEQFAATLAALPAVGALPALPPPPGLPSPEQVAAGLAALPALGSLPGFQPPPPPPGLPTPEQVVGGVVTLSILGAVGGAVLPRLPSITRLFGLPF